MTLSMAASVSGGEITYRTVALTGDDAPGAEPDVTFLSFGSPVINHAGGVGFRCALTGPDVNTFNDQGIWSETVLGLQLVAREGDQAPGAAEGDTFKYLNRPVTNIAGQAAFRGDLIGVSSGSDGGVWSNGSGTLELVAREGSPAPGTPEGVEFGIYWLDNPFSLPAFNDAGDVAFWAGLNGPGVDNANDGGLWAGAAGTLQLAAREGSQAPGADAGVNYQGFGEPRLSNAGQIAFNATLTGTGIDTTNDSGIWSGAPGSLDLVVQEGSPAPGTPAGVNFGTLHQPGFNDAGQVAFHARLAGTGVDASIDYGIWSNGSGSTYLLAREGSSAPGTPAGVYFHSLEHPLLNGAGRTAFYGTLTGAGVDDANDEGIWSEGFGTLDLVAREGSHAPGTYADVVFSSLDEPVLNGAGPTAFRAQLTGVGIDSSNDYGLWAQDPEGLLQLVAREGDLLEVAVGDFRTVSSLFVLAGPSGGQDGEPMAFNDSGQLAFNVLFTDGTRAAIVANVPEPATLSLVFLGVIFTSNRRQKR